MVGEKKSSLVDLCSVEGEKVLNLIKIVDSYIVYIYVESDDEIMSDGSTILE